MFCIFIRNIGERTEQLCYESCSLNVPHENIFVLRNIFPAYKTYKQMFQEAKRLKCDWFLGVDADVVLVKDWYKLALQKKNELDANEWFSFSLNVEDKFFGNVDRGKHFYWGKHVDQAIDILDKKTKYLYKPESSICHYIDYADPHFIDATIGYHGYEQFYKDIFYRFWLQVKRNRDLEKEFPFLKKSNSLDSEDRDYFLAREGWNIGKESRIRSWIRLNNPLFRKRAMSDNSISNTLFFKHVPDLEEKKELEMTLDTFFEKNIKEK